MKLHLGEESESYDYAPNKTTIEVASVLEKRYQIMETFADVYDQKMADDLASEMADRLEKLLSGGPKMADPLKGIGRRIEIHFQEFLTSYEAEGVINGAPTQAALEGRTNRRGAPRGVRRPSFVDTELYKDNFRAWVEE
jgi:hypothetical protein